MIPVNLRTLAKTARVKSAAQKLLYLSPHSRLGISIMDASCFYHPKATGGSLPSQYMHPTPAAQRNGNLSHGGSQSRPRTPRHSLRSSSARTASDRDFERSWTHAPRKPSAVLLAPLSQRCAQKSASSCRQRTGSVTSQSTSSVKPLETEKRTRKHTPRTYTHLRRTCPNHRDSLGRTHARSCASLLLWYARQSIQQTATLTGNTRTLFIMDVVLDLRVEYDDDTLIELLQRRRQDVGSIYTHTCPYLRGRTELSHVLDRSGRYMEWHADD